MKLADHTLKHPSLQSASLESTSISRLPPHWSMLDAREPSNSDDKSSHYRFPKFSEPYPHLMTPRHTELKDTKAPILSSIPKGPTHLWSTDRDSSQPQPFHESGQGYYDARREEDKLYTYQESNNLRRSSFTQLQSVPTASHVRSRSNFANDESLSRSSFTSGPPRQASPLPYARRPSSSTITSAPKESQSNSLIESNADWSAEAAGKRLRISRACQHCKVRKTRCDAVGAFPQAHTSDKKDENEEHHPDSSAPDMIVVHPCTNCIRANIECVYSKKHLKRGPSKGYIKQLEKRLDYLERTLHFKTANDEDGNSSSNSGETRPERRLLRIESFLQKARSGVENERGRSPSSSPPLNQRPSKMAKNTSNNLDDTAAFVTQGDQARFEPPSRLLIAHRTRQMEAIVRRKEQFTGTLLHRSLPFFSSHQSVTSRNIDVSDEVMLGRAAAMLMEPLEREWEAKGGARQQIKWHAVLRSKKRAKDIPHAKRHEILLGRVMGGLHDVEVQEKDHLGGSSAFGTLQEKHKNLQIQHGLEVDALMLCYLDALRYGRPNGAILAASIYRLGGLHPCKEKSDGDIAQCDDVRRHVVAMMLDRWHAVAMNAPHVFSIEKFPRSNLSHSELLGMLYAGSPGDRRDDTTRPAAKILRGAMMMGLYRDKLMAMQGDASQITRDDIEQILSSVGLDEGSDPAGPLDPTSTRHAMRPALRNVLHIYHALQQLPKLSEKKKDETNSKNLSHAPIRACTIDRYLRLVEGILMVPGRGIAINSAALLVKSFIGPTVLAMTAVMLAWLARALVCISRSYLHGDSSHEKIEHLEYLRRSLHDWTHIVSQLALDAHPTPSASPRALDEAQDIDEDEDEELLDEYTAANESTSLSNMANDGLSSSRKVTPPVIVPPAGACSFAPLYARIALFGRYTAEYLDRLGKLQTWPQGQDRNASQPLFEDRMIYASNDANELADVLDKKGPLGLILVATSPEDIWTIWTQHREHQQHESQSTE